MYCTTAWSRRGPDVIKFILRAREGPSAKFYNMSNSTDSVATHCGKSISSLTVQTVGNPSAKQWIIYVHCSFLMRDDTVQYCDDMTCDLQILRCAHSPYSSVFPLHSFEVEVQITILLSIYSLHLDDHSVFFHRWQNKHRSVVAVASGLDSRTRARVLLDKKTKSKTEWQESRRVALLERKKCLSLLGL